MLRRPVVGARYRALEAAAGRVLLAHAQQQVLGQRSWLSWRASSTTAVLEMLDKVRAGGFATMNDKLGSGVWSVAVPFLGRDRQVIGAVTCSNVTHRTDRDATNRECVAMLESTACHVAGAIRLQTDFVLAS
jgi:IclR family transcriptional regulator, pca regulon regulatory protein